MNKKKIIIIGGGISGLTAGVYALDNNFEVEIYEKHYVAGGQCTGWKRKGMYIDGCAHWIVGTNPKSDLNYIWRHIGAFDHETTIYQTEYFCKFDVDGKVVTVYADLEKLEREFLRVAPEDKKMIKHFIKVIRLYQKIKVPLRKPVDHMNLFELINYGFSMLPVVPYLLKYMHVSTFDYASRFKSPILREVFKRLIDGNYNVHSLFYIMQALSKNDAGMVEGGSIKLANNVKNHFISLGGKIHLGKEVEHVLIKDNVAKGVILKDGSVVEADYVIAATDAHHTIFELLQGKYQDKYYLDRFNNLKDNPLQQCFQLSYKVRQKDVFDKPKMMNIKINPIEIADMVIDDISIRNHSFDKSLYKDETTITILMNVTDKVYDYLASLDKKSYNELKEHLGKSIQDEIANYFKLEKDNIELIDVSTPLTYERYTNAYRGSYMSFLTTNKVKGLMRVGLIKGLNNFVLSGQWIMAPGGLPIAIFTGKHAIERICKMEKVKFKELDFKCEYKKELAID